MIETWKNSVLAMETRKNYKEDTEEKWFKPIEKDNFFVYGYSFDLEYKKFGLVFFISDIKISEIKEAIPLRHIENVVFYDREKFEKHIINSLTDTYRSFCCEAFRNQENIYGEFLKTMKEEKIEDAARKFVLQKKDQLMLYLDIFFNSENFIPKKPEEPKKKDEKINAFFRN